MCKQTRAKKSPFLQFLTAGTDEPQEIYNPGIITDTMKTAKNSVLPSMPKNNNLSKGKRN